MAGIAFTADGRPYFTKAGETPVVDFGQEADGTPKISVMDADGGIMQLSRSQSFTVQFDGTKTAKITFPVPFKRVPRIAITPHSQTVSNFFKLNATKTSLTVALQNVYTGLIEVSAFER